MGRCLGSIMTYGPSGSGKTIQIGELAVYVAAKHNKFTRLSSCSGGGWRSIQPHVDKGIVQPCWIRDRKNPFETIDRMSKGWWPEHPDDPESPLIPPEKQKDWGDVGAWAFDSITEACEWSMSNLLGREAAGELRISTETATAKWRDGETNYATAARAHFGTIQNGLMTFIAQSRNQADRYSLWTALELRAQDDITKVPVYGPDLIGRAKTGVAPAWFEDTLHLSIVDVPATKSKGAGQEYRMYLKRHTIGDDPVPYLAKTRTPLGVEIPDFLEGKNCSIFYFLSLMELGVISSGAALEDRVSGINAEFFAELALKALSQKKQ